MRQRIKEASACVVNGLSIALLFYLVSVLQVPPYLQLLSCLGLLLLGVGARLVLLSIAALASNQVEVSS